MREILPQQCHCSTTGDDMASVRHNADAVVESLHSRCNLQRKRVEHLPGAAAAAVW